MDKARCIDARERTREELYLNRWLTFAAISNALSNLEADAIDKLLVILFCSNERARAHFSPQLYSRTASGINTVDTPPQVQS